MRKNLIVFNSFGAFSKLTGIRSSVRHLPEQFPRLIGWHSRHIVVVPRKVIGLLLSLLELILALLVNNRL